MKYERGSFITVASRDMLRGLHPTAQCLYMWLSSYANETGNCFPSRKTLADDCGCSEDTVDKMLRLLIEFGLVTKQNRIEKGEKLSNLYTVLVVRGSRQNRLPYPPTTATLAARNGINSNQLTQPIEGGVATAPQIEIVSEVSEKKSAPKKYPHSKEVFGLWGKYPRNWELNTTQLRAAENLFEEQGLEEIRAALEYWNKHKDEDFCPQVPTPYDLDSKWLKLSAFYDKKHA